MLLDYWRAELVFGIPLLSTNHCCGVLNCGGGIMQQLDETTEAGSFS